MADLYLRFKLRVEVGDYEYKLVSIRLWSLTASKIKQQQFSQLSVARQLALYHLMVM